MKKLSSLFLIAIFTLGACNQDVKDENIRLKDELAKAQAASAEQDSTITNFVETFDLVQNNLDSIRSREEAIREVSAGNLEGTSNAREKVLQDVDAINQLLIDNKAALEKLKRELGNSKAEGRKYLRMVESLNRQIQAKDEEIALLKEDLVNMNFKMDQLNSRVGMLKEATMAQKKVIEEKENELNTAYYSFGTYKELKEAGVVDKEGGFIGIGRTKTLAENFNKDYFTKIDIRTTNHIPFGADFDKVELITNHSSDSYVYEKNGESINGITITNSEQFWKNSKYLVVLLD